MADFNSAWFIAAAIGILLVAIDWLIPESWRKKIGWFLLTVGIFLFSIGAIGLIRDAYWKYSGKLRKPQVVSSNIENQSQVEPPRNSPTSQEKSGPLAGDAPPKTHDQKPHKATQSTNQNVISGGITQGPGSITQIGGEGNTATVNNFGNAEWHLNESQKAAFGGWRIL